MTRSLIIRTTSVAAALTVVIFMLHITMGDGFWRPVALTNATREVDLRLASVASQMQSLAAGNGDAFDGQAAAEIIGRLNSEASLKWDGNVICVNTNNVAWRSIGVIASVPDTMCFVSTPSLGFKWRGIRWTDQHWEFISITAEASLPSNYVSCR